MNSGVDELIKLGVMKAAPPIGERWALRRAAKQGSRIRGSTLGQFTKP
jgi:hypothetical protein